MTPPLLQYDHVTVRRGDQIALDDISLSIPAGEHVAILGPNGSGKSTFIKTLTRECYPSIAGRPSEFRILGRDTWDLFELRAFLGIVTNDLVAACTREVTGRDTILSGFFSSIGVWAHHHVTPAMQQRADEILDLLEVAPLAHRRLDELSSGEARRLVIGRALVHEPKAIVLDEPTNSLDLRASHELREILRKVVHAGTTMILVTHQLPDIIPEIDRVVFLQHGRIVGDGSKANVLTPEALTHLFGVTVDVARRDGYYAAW
jgi:iron complex transport system ATP-binding protein